MKYRASFFYILVPILQIVFYIVAYDVSNYTARKMGLIDSRGVAWGISVQMYLVYYVCIIMVLGVLSYLMEKKVFLLSTIASLLFALLILPVLDDLPYRGGLLILIGIIGVFMNYLFLLKYRSKPVGNV
jgi:hypothetical protein